MANQNQASRVTITAIGEALREAREKKSLTIDQAQKQTHIHSTVIKALEEGRCDDILNPTYVKSFLRKYADYLGLESRRILDEYKALHPESEKSERSSVRTPSLPPEAPADLSGLVTAVKIIAIAIIAGVVLYFVGGRVLAYFKHPRPAKNAVLYRSAAAAKTPKKKAHSKKETTEQLSIPKSVPLKLLMKVNEDVLVKLKTDGNLLFGKVLPKGMAEEFTAEKVINIYVARGESIELVLNGKSLGSPGRGVLQNVEITRRGIRVK